MSFKKIFRLWPAWVLSIAMLMLVYAVAPQQLPLLAYKSAFVTFGAINGYWLHVWTFGHLDDHRSMSNTVSMMHSLWMRVVFMVGLAVAYALAA